MHMAVDKRQGSYLALYFAGSARAAVSGLVEYVLE
jgi:hypothetical protein